MKLQVTQENLSRALSSVSRVASSRAALPVLANVLIKTVGNQLAIIATNLDIAISHTVGSKITKEGSITVPARLMQDLVSSLPSEIITLSVSEQKLHISTDKYNSHIHGISAEEYPVMPAITKGKTWTIAAKKLKQGLQQTVVAASADETRPVLTGVYFHTSGNDLYIVATDSYRLAEKKLIESGESISILIPANAAQEVLRLIGDYQEEITITHDDQQVRFQIGGIELVTRLIEGKYPDYKRLIPTSFENSAVIQRDDLASITKVSSLFARESAGSVQIHTDEQQQKISINSIASQVGDNTGEAEAKVKGSGLITLNSRYIIDALQVLQGDTVEIGFNGKLEPCVIKDPKNKDYIHIIMPLKS